MSAWLFARGRAAQQTLSAPLIDGATVIALAGADSLFAAGQQIFAAADDDGNTQRLGRVTDVSHDSLTVSAPPRETVPAGGRLWRAADWHGVNAAPALPERRQLDLGTRCERTLAGGSLSFQLAMPRLELRLRLAGLTPAAEKQLADWLLATTQSGLLPFTLLPASGEWFSARLSGEPLERVAEKGDRVSLTLPLIALEHGKFQ